MVPSLARPSICGLQAALAACRISAPTAATSPALASLPRRRAFTTTPPAAEGFTVPPESPRFIALPDPPQASEPKLPPIKGHLPVPRDIFPRREGRRKVRPSYVAAATKMSQAELAGEAPRSEQEARRRVMAAARRKAFSVGIQGLYHRKTFREARLKARSDAVNRAHREAATAPEGLDDVLTRSTVRLAEKGSTRVILDPHRFERALASRERHAQEDAAKAEARRDALTQLYVAAEHFIVDEAELEARINQIFVEGYHGAGILRRSQSIWDQHGSPVSVHSLQQQMAASDSSVSSHARAPTMKTTERQKTVAEELTGGKL
ncbi:hypothetical protein C8A05DRAFT_17230 [Staphylotrichum tortipilum]|uniref:Uncharacterized protein n=1 Tax=Staphylotrichum tortipilum TaxID=2831512 RepID=A0AAN6MGH5_9PEZI|nr:hypothetical protein C8A05DRAFT_17230 [Staphylotrichum longicolle]